MRFTPLLRLLGKRLVKTRSTRRYLLNLSNAMVSSWGDVTKQVRYGRSLETACRGRTGILLHVGCGELAQLGWINIDFQPRSGVFYHNMLNPLPIKDQTVNHIHAEHFLEHLDHSDAIHFLSECHRVLIQGGTMRIIVPDAEKYMRAYVSDDRVFFERLKDLGGASESLPTKGLICNQMFRMGGDHRFAWDFETLEHAARVVGFNSIKKSYHNDTSVVNCIDGQDWWRAFESLYANVTR
jgi:predicted SAM-dependent methyltransferase